MNSNRGTFTPEQAEGLPGPQWLKTARLNAAQRFAKAELPSEAEEIWRYSRIDELDLNKFHPPQIESSLGDSIPSQLSSLLDFFDQNSGFLLFHNGKLVKKSLSQLAQDKKVKIGSVQETPADIFDSVPLVQDAFSDLSVAFLLDAAVIDIPAGVDLEDPIVILHLIDEPDIAVFPRTVIRAGEGSNVEVLDHLVSTDVNALVCSVSELDVKNASNLTYLFNQDLGPKVWQLGYQSSRVGKEASFESFTSFLGGDYARMRTDSRLVGQGGSVKLLAAYYGDGSQVHDFRTLQEHSAPKTTSELLFKGAVQGKARSVYSGLIKVENGASGTNAFQTNRNLVLSEGAHAYSVPNLEIDENEVSCSHASAVGPIDKDHLYYLESRGIPTSVAERLIVLGFFEDILSRNSSPQLQDWLRISIAKKLNSGFKAAADLKNESESLQVGSDI